MKISALVILGIVSLVFLAGCGSGSSQPINNQSGRSGSNPTPTITTISPNSAMAGGAPFTLRILGTNFVAASTVNFGGTAGTNTTVSPTQLWVAIPASAIASPGTAAVTVTNPGPGGGISNAASFTIASGDYPIPTMSDLRPSGAAVGGPDFALSIRGDNFVA